MQCENVILFTCLITSAFWIGVFVLWSLCQSTSCFSDTLCFFCNCNPNHQSIFHLNKTLNDINYEDNTNDLSNAHASISNNIHDVDIIINDDSAAKTDTSANKVAQKDLELAITGHTIDSHIVL